VVAAAVIVPVLACLTAAAATPEPAPAAGPTAIVVTAAAPIDPQRLADAMRTYLDEYGIRVQNGGAAEPGDLRVQLADARRMGESVRALAVVHAESGARGTLEVELYDLATEKALIAELPRPARDEDLYRALALKIQAVLRATLSEAPERLGPGSPVTRLVVTPVPPPAPPAAEARAPAGRWAIETGYLLVAFPLGPQGALQGLALTAAFAPAPWLELTLGSAALGSARAQAHDVVAVATVVPVFGAARLRLARGRLGALVGPSVEVAYVGVAPSSAQTAVQAMRHTVPAVGAEAEGRVRVGAAAWLFVRATALAVLLGEGYRVDGDLVLDTSRFQIAASAGIGMSVW
jgi:hypothetical protein